MTSPSTAALTWAAEIKSDPAIDLCAHLQELATISKVHLHPLAFKAWQHLDRLSGEDDHYRTLLTKKIHEAETLLGHLHRGQSHLHHLPKYVDLLATQHEILTAELKQAGIFRLDYGYGRGTELNDFTRGQEQETIGSVLDCFKHRHKKSVEGCLSSFRQLANVVHAHAIKLETGAAYEDDVHETPSASHGPILSAAGLSSTNIGDFLCLSRLIAPSIPPVLPIDDIFRQQISKSATTLLRKTKIDELNSTYGTLSYLASDEGNELSRAFQRDLTAIRPISAFGSVTPSVKKWKKRMGYLTAKHHGLTHKSFKPSLSLDQTDRLAKGDLSGLLTSLVVEHTDSNDDRVNVLIESIGNLTNLTNHQKSVIEAFGSLPADGNVTFKDMIERVEAAVAEVQEEGSGREGDSALNDSDDGSSESDTSSDESTDDEDSSDDDSE